MHCGILNMESFLIIGLMLFIYTKLVQTTTRDDIIKEFRTGILKEITHKREMAAKRSQQDGSIPSTWKRIDEKTEKVDDASEKVDDANKKVGDTSEKVGDASELKKEIIEALVKILYDELQKKTNVEVSKKQMTDKFTQKDEYKNEDAAIPPRRPGPPGLWGRDEINVPPGIWGRDELRGPPGLWGKKEAKSVESDQIHRKASRGPPGLWGRGILDAHQIVSDAGPPGLWGRDVVKDVEEQKLSENGPPGLWGREAEKETMTSNKQTDDLSKNDN